MKTVVLKVICSGCLQDKDCVGIGGDESKWYCEDCAKTNEYKNKSDVLVQAGWLDWNPEKKKLLFRVEVTACVSRTYEVEAENEEQAREIYRDEGDLVDEDEDYEDIDYVRVTTQKD